VCEIRPFGLERSLPPVERRFPVKLSFPFLLSTSRHVFFCRLVLPSLIGRRAFSVGLGRTPDV